MQKRKAEPEKGCIAASLLAWYGRERRDLPWRAGLSETPDPYRVWLSEIMLQQTTVKAVLPRYAAFLRQWPNVKALAAAELGQVLAAWAGLGYYARARNLHACARAVVAHHGGRFPQNAAALRELPEIGDYTAAAIAAIAFGERATPVDGNIERVVARLFAVTDAAAGGEGRDQGARRDPDAGQARRRLRASDDGFGRHDLHAATAGLRALSVAARLPRLCRRHRERAPLPRGEARTADAARRRLRRAQARRRGSPPPAAAQGSPRRHARNAVLALGEGPAERESLKRLRAAQGGLAQAAGRGRAQLHPFSFGTCRLSRRCRARRQAKRAAAPKSCGFVARRDLARAALPSLMRKVLDHAFEGEARTAKAGRQASRARPRAGRRSA